MWIDCRHINSIAMKQISVRYQVDTRAIKKAEDAVNRLCCALQELKKQGIELTIKTKRTRK